MHGPMNIKNVTCVSQILTDQQTTVCVCVCVWGTEHGRTLVMGLSNIIHLKFIKDLNWLQNTENDYHTFVRLQIRRLKRTRYIGELIQKTKRIYVYIIHKQQWCSLKWYDLENN